MTRSQRLWHARTFVWLPLLLAAALSYAIASRESHKQRLAERAAPAVSGLAAGRSQ
jgi:hypothetical protein